MRASLMTRAFVALGALVVTLGLTQAQPVQLAFWDFNDNNDIVDGGVNGGTLSLIGGVTHPGFFAGSPLDGNNSGYQTTNYPTQGQNNLTAGIVFNTPTTGYINITVQFDVRWSNTASKYLRFQYTTDGTNWISGPQLVAGGGDQWYSQNILAQAAASSLTLRASLPWTTTPTSRSASWRSLLQAKTTITEREMATRLGIVPLALCATTL
jgi:hypothetical protein